MDVVAEFTVFVKQTEPRLSYALTAAYGVEVGRESTADALVYAWENWPKVRCMENPSGYLYRVGQSSARRYRRPRLLFLRSRRRSCLRWNRAYLLHWARCPRPSARGGLGLCPGVDRKGSCRPSRCEPVHHTSPPRWGLAKLRAALEVTTDA